MCKCENLNYCTISNIYFCDDCGANYSPNDINKRENGMEITEIEELTRLVDKTIHRSVGEISKMLKEERLADEEYLRLKKEKRLIMGKIVHDLKPFDSRVTELYPELKNTFWDLNREYDESKNEN